MFLETVNFCEDQLMAGGVLFSTYHLLAMATKW